MPDAPTRLLAIANANAGSTAEDTLEEAMAVLRSHCPDVTVARTGSPDELDDVLTGLGDLDERRLVVIGGDGSIHAVVASLHRNGLLDRAEVALVPLGTGNDFARTLGVPLDAATAARIAGWCR